MIYISLYEDVQEIYRRYTGEVLEKYRRSTGEVPVDLDRFDEFPPEFITYFLPDFVMLAQFFA